MTLEELWRQKSDQELELAARQIAEYREEAQQVIRDELKRRKLPEPKVFTRTVVQRNPELLGNCLERLRLDGFASEHPARWIIGIPLALLFGLLLLASATHSIGNLIWGVALVGGSFWSIYRAINYQNCYLLLYEKGVVYEQPNQRQSAYYDELQIWQDIKRVSVNFFPSRTSYWYTIQFPSGDRLDTIQKIIGEKLQEMMTQYQLPQMLELYNQGYTITMGSVYLDKKKIIINGESLNWSDVSHLDVIKGKLCVYKVGGRFPAVRILISEIPNVYVLLNLLKHLGY
ncbi:MAG: hypothetical protein KAF91_00100 [Nostoc sp. TH1S01]|nr:hypothetical protein [Nostoc sp. TH1S01]